jgi:hypothetical protein
MQPVPKWWLWPNLLSLDAPAVALVWQRLFARCFRAPIATSTALLLVASVWLIYAADRALDAWHGDAGAPRHRFYKAHWRLFLPLWMIVFAVSVWMALTQLPAVLLWRGLTLLSAVVVYFIGVHAGNWSLQALWPKEASVGLLFALGASLVAWTNIRTPFDAAGIALFFVLCWINCAAIQKWESGDTACMKQMWRIDGMAMIAAALAGLLLLVHQPALGAAEMASALALVLLDRFWRRFSLDALRVLADVALLSPLLLLPMAGASTF